MERIDLARDTGDDFAAVKLEVDLHSCMCCECAVVNDLDSGNVSRKGRVHEDVVSACPFELVVG